MNLFGREKGKKNKRKTYWTAIATATSHPDELVLLLLIRVVVGIVVGGGAFLFLSVVKAFVVVVGGGGVVAPSFRCVTTLDQFLNYLNMKPYTSLLGVLCSLGYHIERI